MEGHRGRPDEIRVAFDLVDLRGHASLGHDPLQVLGLEVGDADRPGPALLAQRDEALPPVDVSVAGRVGPVQQEQVDVVQPESFEVALEPLGGLRDAVPLGVDLRRDEQVGARHTAGRERATDAALVLVVLGRVDVPIPDLDGGQDCLLGLLVIQRPGAKGDLRHPGAAGQGERGRCGGHTPRWHIRPPWSDLVRRSDRPDNPARPSSGLRHPDSVVRLRRRPRRRRPRLRQQHRRTARHTASRRPRAGRGAPRASPARRCALPP